MNLVQILSTLRRQLCRAGVWAGVLGIVGAFAMPHAQAMEKTPLTIVVGFPAGGSVDVIARVVGDAMRDDFSAVVVENKPGAAGRIALGSLRGAPIDGTKVIIAPFAGLVLHPHLYKKLPYDPLKDFTPISTLAVMPFAVTAGPRSGIKNIKELTKHAKAKPEEATFGSSGEGSVGQLLGAWLGQLIGSPLRHVPFQGGAPATLAMMGGNVLYKIDALSETTELHKDGKALVLGVTGVKRDPLLPDVPTMKEQGVDMVIESTFVIYGPANLPKDVVHRLNQSVVKAVRSPDTVAKMTKLGFQAVGSTPAETADNQQRESAVWGRLVNTIGLSLD